MQVDQHVDRTNDYIYNEVAIDYNAAFVGACAGLLQILRGFFNADRPVKCRRITYLLPPTPTPPDTQIVYGDLNGDQKVTSTDYTMLKRYLMKSPAGIRQRGCRFC